MEMSTGYYNLCSTTQGAAQSSDLLLSEHKPHIKTEHIW